MSPTSNFHVLTDIKSTSRTENNQINTRESFKKNLMIKAGMSMFMFTAVASPIPLTATEHLSSLSSARVSTYNIGTKVNNGSVSRRMEVNLVTPKSRASHGARSVQSKVVKSNFISKKDSSGFFPEHTNEYVAADRPFQKPLVLKSSGITRGFIKK